MRRRSASASLLPLVLALAMVMTQAPPAEAAFAQVSVGLETSGNKDGGVAWGDFNNDGCLDALVNTTNLSGPDTYTRLYRSDCDPVNPSFADVTVALAIGLQANQTERGALWGDLNNDGLLDIAVNGSTRIEVYFNNGFGAGFSFGIAGGPNVVYTSLGGGLNAEGMGIIDFDGDGDLDLIIDNHDFGIDILENDGAGGFSHATPNGDPGGIGLPEVATTGDYAAVADFDRDGDVDFVARKEGQADIWVNGGGTFSANAFDQPAINTNKGGVSFCDFDNDGDFDLFWTDNGTNQVWRNDAGAFVATAEPSAPPASGVDGVACGDVDNDGLVDLFLTTDSGADLLYPNTSTGPGVISFGASVAIGSGNGEGVAFGDYDRDGDLDLLINRHLGTNQLWRNDAVQGGAVDYLNIDVQHDLGGGLTRDAIGATVRLLACDGTAVSGVREVNGGRGHGSQDPALVHFGLPFGSSQRYIVEAKFPTGETTQNVIVPSAIAGYRIAQVTNMSSDISACLLSGTIFEDLTGNALDGGETVGDAVNPGVDGVDVWLYRDDGGVPNLPDATDTLVAGPVATSGGGSYSFSTVDGTYWVVADSQDLGAVPTWAEQTFGPNGGWCADGSGGTTERSGSGPCYGGRRAASSDDLSTWHSGAEHISRVVVSGAAVSNVDFGFSFNVVTSTRGGDATVDPGAVGAQTVQGSLRQFIQNANALVGPNSMRFVPAEAQNDGTGTWWRISVTSALPSIVNDNTTIDGTAYSLADGSTVLDSNPATLGGGVVGVDNVVLPAIGKPELEIVGNRVVEGIVVLAGGDDTVIRDLSVWGFSQNIHVNGAVRFLVENNVIGTPPDAFADPGAARTSSRNVLVEFSSDWTLRDNLVGFSDSTGIAIYEATSTGWTITGNEFRSNSLNASASDGIAVHASATGTIEANLITDSAGFGVDARQVGDGLVIRNNTISGNGHGNGSPTQTGGIRLMGSGHLVDRNIISGQTGPGIIIAGLDLNPPDLPFTPSINNHITKNHFIGNGGNAIDLNKSGTDHQTGDGVTPNGTYGADAGNNGLDAPVITSATTTAVSGTACALCRVELYRAVSGAGDGGYGEGVEYLGFEDADGTGNWTVAGVTAALADQDVSAIAIDASNDTSEFGANVTVNVAPVLDPVGDQSVDELTLLSFVATASDPNAGDSLTFSMSGAPVGASITAGGAFTWTPTESQGPGSYVFDVVVTDDGTPNLSDSETITVTVAEDNLAPVLDPVGDQSSNELALLSFTATASDPDTPANTLVFSLSGAPAGASITAGGAFTWTPTEAQGPGAYSFDVVVTDNGTPNLADSETITVTVNEVNLAPVLDPVGDRSVSELSLLSFTATASDPDVPANTLTFSLSGAPVGASITAGGAFTWTPTEAQGPGAYAFDVVVTDDGTPNLADSETITVTVSEGNLSPVLDPVGDQSVDELVLLSFTATASDPDTPANLLTFSLNGAPAGAVITAGGAFTWTPTEAQGPGAYSFDVVVTETDGSPTNLSDSETITVTVGEVNLAPVLDPVGDQSVDELVLLSFTATATDPDMPANTLVFSLSGAPVGASITAGGAFTWTPTESQGPGAYIFDVVVTETDGSPTDLSDSETITVTVNEVNLDPVLAFVGNKAVDELVLLSFTATATDPDTPANTLVFSLSGAPVGASITAGGAFTWTPTEAQGSGAYIFDVVVTETDGSPTDLSDSETITVTVGEDNVAPTLDPIGDQSVDELTTLSFTAKGFDPDAPANTLLFSLVGGPAGAVIDPNTGVFSWTPTESQGPGSYLFDVVVTDNGVPNLSDSESITVTVGEVNVAPVLDPVGDQSVDELVSLSFTATATDPDTPANSLTFSLSGAPAGAVITAGGAFSWTPTEAQGPASFTFDVVVTETDGSPTNLSDSETITVTVGEVNVAPVADPIADVTIDELTLLSFIATATDVDVPANTLAWSLDSGPGAISPAGVFTWTPTEAQGPGTFTVVLRVTDDGAGTLSETVSFDVTVDEVNGNLPIANDDGAFLIAEGGSLTVVAPGVLVNDTDADIPANILTPSVVGAPSYAVSLTLNPDGSFTYVHDGTENFVDSFTYELSDGANTSLLPATVSVTVTPVNDNTPITTDDPYAGILEGETITVSAAAGILANDTDADLPGDTLTVNLLTDVTYGTLAVASDGSFIYVHDGSENHSDAFTYEVFDGVNTSAVAAVTLSITPVNDQVPAALDDAYGPVTEGGTLTVAAASGVLFNDSDGDLPGDTLSAILLTDVTNGTLVLSPDGSFTYAHDDSENFTDGFTYQIFDGVNTSAAATVTLTIDPVNDNVPVVPPSTFTVDEGATLSPAAGIGVLASAFDEDGDPVTAVLAGSPAFGTLAFFPDGSFTYIHDGSENFSDVFTFTATDGTNSTGPIAVTIDVTPVNDLPVISGAMFIPVEGVAVGTILGAPVGSDGDGDLLLFAITNPDPAFTIDALTGDITVSAALDYETVPTYALTVSVTDPSGASASAVVIVDVIDVNEAPVAASAAFPIVEDLAVGSTIGAVFGSDPEGEAVSYTLVGGDPAGQFVIDPITGDLILVAPLDAGVVPSYLLDVVISDPAGNTTALAVIVIVNPAATLPSVNAAPLGISDIVSLDEDTSVILAPLLNDSDPDGDVLFVAWIDEPINGTLIANGDGTYLYRPNLNFNGTESLSYGLGDGRGGTDTSTVVLAIRSVNDVPVSPNLSAVLEFDSEIEIPIPGGIFDPDGDPVQISLQTPANGTVTLTNGGFLYVAPPQWNGTDTFTYLVTDGRGGSSTGLVTVRVTQIDGDLVAIDLVSVEAVAPSSPAPSSGVVIDSIRLLIGTVTEMAGLLSIPLLAVGAAFLFSVLFGLSRNFVIGRGPVFLAATTPDNVAVVRVPAGSMVAALEGPGDEFPVIHRFEPAERGIRATGRRAQRGSTLWLEVETPRGDGWVIGRLVTREIPVGFFASDETVKTMLLEMGDTITARGDFKPLVSEHGLEVAYYAPPKNIAEEELTSLLTEDATWGWWDPTGSTPSVRGEFTAMVADPLREAITTIAGRAVAEAVVDVPVELENFPSMTFSHSDRLGWRVFFEYEDDQPKLAAIWREGVTNSASI